MAKKGKSKKKTTPEVTTPEVTTKKAPKAVVTKVSYENASSGESEITVIHEKANRLSLPYKSSNGGLKICILNPGKNLVGISVWDAIKEMAGEEDWAHYSRHFQIKEIAGSERGSVSDLETPAFLDIIENTFSLPELESYSNLEKNKKTGSVRKGILTAINKQIKKVEATKADIEKKKKKKE